MYITLISIISMHGIFVIKSPQGKKSQERALRILLDDKRNSYSSLLGKGRQTTYIAS